MLVIESARHGNGPARLAAIAPQGDVEPAILSDFGQQVLAAADDRRLVAGAKQQVAFRAKNAESAAAAAGQDGVINPANVAGAMRTVSHLVHRVGLVDRFHFDRFRARQIHDHIPIVSVLGVADLRHVFVEFGLGHDEVIGDRNLGMGEY